jgi:diadenylate cyclase
MRTSVTMFINTLYAQIRIADLVDIAVVAFFLYAGLLWLKQRATYSVVLTIAVAAWLYVLAYLLGMRLTLALFQAGLTAILVALVLIFQQDIRRTFDRFATRGVFHRQHPPTALSQTIDILVESMSLLAANHIGALVVIKKRELLDRHIRGGIPVNGQISQALLYSIFHPQSPGHDGAVLVEGNQIDRLGVHLPLSANLQEVGEAGTRHTAALGMTERSDALVIVVSEERGMISVAERGKLDTIGSAADLKERLQHFYQDMVPSTPEVKPTAWLTRHLGSKLAAVGMASVLWLLFAYHAEPMQRTVPVKVQFEGNLPPLLRLRHVKVQPPSVQVLLQQADGGKLTEIRTTPLNLNEIRESTTVRVPLLLPEQVQLLPGTEATVRVTIDVTANVPRLTP